MLNFATRQLINSQAGLMLGPESPLSMVSTAMLLRNLMLVAYEDSSLVKLV